MTRLAAALAEFRLALVCFITAGDGGVATIFDVPVDASVGRV